jgi:hypothetical protein
MNLQAPVPHTDWDEWRARRISSLLSPTGNLALIETRWLQDDEELTLEEALVGQPESVTATRLVRKDFDGEIIANGIRLWDSNSEAIRSFSTIDVYPFDPNWIFEGKFTAYSEARPVPFEYVREKPGLRDLAVPGEIRVTIAGTEYALDAFDDDGPLLLVFGDPTNRSETYPAGRFLFVHRIADSDRVLVDFNLAFVPPCGFSIHYNCPLPPPQNRLQVAIHAGEKNPIFRNNYEIH